MSTIPVSSASPGVESSGTTGSPRAESSLGRDAFLGLLVTQLQHQNPLQPQADGEFLAQLAQFSSLEQLQDIRKDMAQLLALFDRVVVPSTDSQGAA